VNETLQHGLLLRTVVRGRSWLCPTERGVGRAESGDAVWRGLVVRDLGGGTKARITRPRHTSLRGSGPCRLLGADLRPRQLAHEEHLLVDLALGRFVAEDTTQVFDFRRDQLVVLREEANRCGLEIAFRDGDELGGPGDVLAQSPNRSDS